MLETETKFSPFSECPDKRILNVLCQVLNSPQSATQPQLHAGSAESPAPSKGGYLTATGCDCVLSNKRQLFLILLHLPYSRSTDGCRQHSPAFSTRIGTQRALCASWNHCLPQIFKMPGTLHQCHLPASLTWPSKSSDHLVVDHSLARGWSARSSSRTAHSVAESWRFFRMLWKISQK